MTYATATVPNLCAQPKQSLINHLINDHLLSIICIINESITYDL